MSGNDESFNRRTGKVVSADNGGHAICPACGHRKPVTGFGFMCRHAAGGTPEPCRGAGLLVDVDEVRRLLRLAQDTLARSEAMTWPDEIADNGQRAIAQEMHRNAIAGHRGKVASLAESLRRLTRIS